MLKCLLTDSSCDLVALISMKQAFSVHGWVWHTD